MMLLSTKINLHFVDLHFLSHHLPTPSDVDKGLLISLLELLKIFYECSILAQSDQQTTISSVVPLIYRLQNEWLVPSANLLNPDVSAITSFKLEARRKLSNFYPFEKINAALKATALDPRFELQFLSKENATAVWKEIIQEFSKHILEAVATTLAEDLDAESEIEDEGEVEQTGNPCNSALLYH